MSTPKIEVFAFAGSLRTESYNRKLLDACAQVAPDRLSVKSFELDDVPLYNADVEAQGDPDSVSRLKNGIESADGLLIATPEYNHGLPAVTKNALDWASRTGNRSSSVLSQKPVAIAGATPGSWGTARSQKMLRQSLDATGALTMVKPEVLLARAGDKFDDSGRLTDEKTREFVRKFMESFRDWILHVQH